MKEKITRYAMWFSVSFATLWTISGPIEQFKQYLNYKYDRAKSNLIATIAESSGYVLPMDEYTAIELAEREAIRAQINPALVRAVMHVESGSKQSAESPKGAISYMQVMPANHKRCKLDHWHKLWIPENNIKCGVQILSEELKAYNGDLVSALMVYNGGPDALKYKYAESVKYSKMVLAKLAKDIR